MARQIARQIAHRLNHQLNQRQAIARGVVLGMTAGVCSLLAIGWNHAAIAQNLSDVTGTNVGDIPAPTVNEVPAIPDEVVATAQQLAEDLENAYAECAAATAAAPSTPRRFARGTAPDEVCTNPACDRYTQLVQQARTFLNSLDAAQREQLQQRASSRLW